MNKHILAGALCLIGIVSAITAQTQTAAWTQYDRNKDTAHEVAELLRDKGYPEDNPVIIACQEWWQAEDEASQAAIVYTTDTQRKEYPAAALVWQLLREAGLSEPVCAGIIGNMMAEVGGHTLELQPYTRVDGFYGLCAWALQYTPQVDSLDIHGQIGVLLDTLQSNIEAGGGSFRTFLALTDAREAAKYFSDYYERPAVWATIRADNAETALRYFGG